MMMWDLPTQIEVGGTAYDIRTDFRDVLRILCAFEDPDLDEREKALVCLQVLYEDIDNMPPALYAEAIEKAREFIDHGAEGKQGAKTMDWEQDANLLFPAVNAAAGTEVRQMEYLHWWTFLGYFGEIGEGLFSTVINIRYKRANGKKLDKWEHEFLRKHKEMIIFYTDEERQAIEETEDFLKTIT